MEPLSNAMLELHRHSTWANERLLDAAEVLSPVELGTPVGSGGFGTLLETLIHMYDTQNAFYHYLTERVNPPSPAADEFPDIPSLRSVWNQLDLALDTYLAALDDEQVTRQVPKPTWWSEPGTLAEWEEVVHLLLHSQQHRGEVALVLTELGHSPGELDYNDYLRG